MHAEANTMMHKQTIQARHPGITRLLLQLLISPHSARTGPTVNHAISRFWRSH